ncbi:bifunctional DNA-formamidopyrimidine glycosylase/DNA-(apurinic or apyrimidinic site) lyase [Desulfopila sp. IMCC35006]|uniref:bifunctional DNA-formamidopyrimidine glycosylase/DNA-(apurinic or apyrimidinic site) lyase n=1 Tax=Desulfopila sp. IMCC35006 TaxID=2569542 RepID=UPI0010AC59C6|nr:bifunctional DNA-formamidopyrimidine glycosylase/DNA-(apurinic or apyrimidinic site) lyase [Desulfopila sp. IMCC35006]TKB23982.1 bifunctional DNA-formamidopyrimidine glycosylase/DNA-(apurinic or apyrimidinic site) lyase [Desulfopila sp. IMCC35006]
MPELPEVEVVCRGLRPFLIGHTVNAIHWSGKKLRHPVQMEAMQQAVINRKITTIERRAKFLQISLSSGAMLIIHLGMTGNLGIFPPSTRHAKHDHVWWSLDNGTELRYNDSRRFGSIRLLTPEEVANREETIFKTAGPEPFSDQFSARYLHALAKGKSLAVKLFIMTNQNVAGIGNIYANESLFAAGIRPTRKVQTLTLKEWDRLVTEVRRVLGYAIECGGSTISDFLNASQQRGYFQINFKVYGRAGETCIVCSDKIEKQTIGGRASYFCSKCQK